MLTQKQIDFYNEFGYLGLQGVLSKDEVAELRRVTDEFVDKSRAVTQNDAVFDLEPGHTAENPRLRRLKDPYKHHEVYKQVLHHPKILDAVSALVGSYGLRCNGNKLNMKYAEYGSPVEWHQDWAFYPHTNDDLLAIGVMLDDVELENGPLLVMPGTHRVPKVWDHHLDGRFCGAMDPANTPDLDYSRAVACTGRAGSCSFHHVRLVHGSAQNTSVKPRNLLLYECAAADAWPLTALNFGGLDDFNSRMICGEPTLEARLEKVPVRMPYPPALAQGSIYENQTALRNRFFEIKQAAT